MNFGEFFAGVKGQLSFTLVCMGLTQMISSPQFKFYQPKKMLDIDTDTDKY